MVNKDKKIILNEGRVISNGKLHYGGFPRKLNEGGIVSDYNDSDGINDQGVNQATKPDSLENLSKKARESFAAVTTFGRSMQGVGTDEQRAQLRKMWQDYDAALAAEESHPDYVKPKLPAGDMDFHKMGQDDVVDASFGRRPTPEIDSDEVAGRNRGPKRMPPTIFDLGTSPDDVRKRR